MMPQELLVPALIASVALVVVWLAVLTVFVLRRRPAPDEPVFRKLPNGRTRFTVGVARGLGRAERRVSVDLDLRPRSADRDTVRSVPTER